MNMNYNRIYMDEVSRAEGAFKEAVAEVVRQYIRYIAPYEFGCMAEEYNCNHDYVDFYNYTDCLHDLTGAADNEANKYPGVYDWATINRLWQTVENTAVDVANKVFKGIRSDIEGFDGPEGGGPK